MAVSHKDWELPNSRFDWLKSILTASRFSHLDRLHFAVKKLQIKIQECSPFSFIFFSIIYGSAKKPDDKRKVKRTSKFRLVLVKLIAFRKQNQ